jgi:alpha-galactosidase
MTRLLVANGIKYLKIDYNDSIGTGCDPENPQDGLGEGLRAHLEAVKSFYEELRSEIPDLVFENCSSGGHRIEPGFVSLSSMSSFSDAHETVEIPVIAANLHRLIPPARNQVWAVLRREDDEQRLNWSLAATFLGRMCLSGDIQSLDRVARNRVARAIRLYRRAVPVIRSGRSRLVRNIAPSYRHPEGWQCVLRETIGADRKQILAVFHAFSNEFPPEITIPLPDSNWVLEDSLFEGDLSVGLEGLRVRFPHDFSGGVAILSQPD